MMTRLDSRSMSDSARTEGIVEATTGPRTAGSDDGTGSVVPPSIEQLLRADSGLTRSFAAAVVTFLASTVWTLFVANTTPDGGPELTTTGAVLLVAQLAAYVWYAIAAGAAARVLGDAGWKYVAWILLAPFLARLPIPIVSTLIAVSPLSIKFLLGGQLQTAIRESATLRDS